LKRAFLKFLYIFLNILYSDKIYLVLQGGYWLKITELICTFPCVIILGLFGIYFSCKSRFIQVKGLKTLISESKSKESLSTFATALGGTVGIGSITGIGFSISQGGAGSIFWMWVSSFFAMGIKYAETYIAVKYKGKNSGGAMYALKSAGYTKMGILFAVITIFASLGGGNSAQSGAMSEAFGSIGVSSFAVAFISAIVLFIVLFGGKERIIKVNSVLVPLSTVLYILGAGIILFKSRENIPSVLSYIIKDAFGIKQMSAGASTYMFTRALRVGCIRGVFSHEAGMGSSPIAHASAVDASPQKQGMFAVAEIYVDTFLVGTLTAFCLLCNDTYFVSKLFLEFFGNNGGVLFAFFMAVFAVAAVLSWCYYSEACIGFIFGQSQKVFRIYKIVAILTFSLGCIVPMDFSLGMSDVLNCLMTYPNLFLLFIKRKEIFYGGEKKRSYKVLGRKFGDGIEESEKLTKRTNG
jgi:AGCS family alanine or glycine:cation symporter